MLNQGGLEIYQLQGSDYQLQPLSRYCPPIDLPRLTARVLQAAAAQGTSAAIRALRQQLISGIESI